MPAELTQEAHSLSEWLTKSRLLAGHQCAKRLWLEVNQPELGAGSGDSEALFRIGRVVGEVARTLYPGGSLVGRVMDPAQAVRDTEALLAEPGPLTLYEAAFSAGSTLTRVDIFQRDDAGRTRLIEVKAAGSVKDIHLVDCAIQVEILKRSGIGLDQVVLAHIDSSFVYPGDGDYQGLLAEQNLTEELEELLKLAPGWIADSERVLRSAMPAVAPGKHCKAPYVCPFFDICNEPGPEYPVAILPGKRAVKTQLLEDGYEDVRQIPEGYLSDSRAEWMRAVTVSGQPDVKPEATAILSDLAYPRYYLDFETVGPVVPIWAGTKPYEALPFQWSCHVEAQEGSIEHLEYLAADPGPPMRGFAQRLLESVGDSGPIFTYSSYERTVIQRLSSRFEDLQTELLALLPRLVDLLPITRAHYYHPQLKGSWSIKSVLPTISEDLGYDRLTGIKEGLGASEGYLEMIAHQTAPERKVQLQAELLEYCRLDTLAMVKLAHFLAAGN